MSEKVATVKQRYVSIMAYAICVLNIQGREAREERLKMKEVSQENICMLVIKPCMCVCMYVGGTEPTRKEQRG